MTHCGLQKIVLEEIFMVDIKRQQVGVSFRISPSGTLETNVNVLQRLRTPEVEEAFSVTRISFIYKEREKVQ